MPAVRVFAPPEDRVKELFAGAHNHSHVADRKLQEHERKKAYAAELQAQMQERQAQRQEERQHRFGPVKGAQTATSSAADARYASLGAAADASAADTASFPAASSQACDAPPSPVHAAPLQQQQQQQPLAGQYQQPNWPSTQTVLGLGSDTMHGPGSHSSSSPHPWLQHTLHQSQQPPGFGMGSLLQPQQPLLQQPYAGWPMPPQQPPLGSHAWPGSGLTAGMGGPPFGYDNPYSTTAITPSYASMGSSCSPNSLSPGRGFQAGANAAAAVAAMQAAAARSGCLGPPGVNWAMSPTAAAAAAADAPFAQQQWSQNVSYKGPGSLGAPGGFSPGAYGGMGASSGYQAAAADATPGAGSLGMVGSSGSSPQGGRGPQDKARKDAYRAELEAQIRERAERQAAEKAQRAAEEARKEAEIASYSPWGRGGAGAPLRDASGQVVTGLRGAARQQQQQQQQLQQWQQNHDQQQQQQQEHMAAGLDASSAWQQQQQSGNTYNDNSALQADPSRTLLSTQSFGQQQQQQQQRLGRGGPNGGNAGSGGGSGLPGQAGAGPAPVLCFRSDKAFMTSNEIEAKQRQQKELQLELDRQVQEKKRQKELKRQQEEEEARQEEARLAAEQARLAAQFQSEQEAEHGRRHTKEQEGAASGAGARSGGGELQAAKSEGRRRVSVLMAGDEPTPARPQQQHDQGLAAQSSSSTFGAAIGLQQQGQANPYQQQQQQQQQQPPFLQQFQQQQMPFGMLQQASQGMFDAQQRNQMLFEALQLEGHQPVNHAANHELSRLRHDMEAQAAALRSAVESQGREVAALRATAAAAEAESAAAKAELAQVKRDIKRKSQELPHETLSTMLADYGDGPASTLINAAFHPNPIRRIDLELPPSAAALRRSIELQARADVAARSGAPGAMAGSSSGLLGSSGSAVDLLESLLQQGKAAAPGASAGALGGKAGRSASVPAAGSAGGPPGWLGSVPLGGVGNLRGSMLAAESTFIFPAGLQPSAAAAGAAGEEPELGSSSAARHGSGELGGASSAWHSDWQQQGQGPVTRHTTSAPGYSSSKAGMPLRPTLSYGRGREGLVTPGGSDLMAVVDRNADKLRVLENMPETGSTEALDQFLSTFVAQTSQPKQPTASGSATPVSRLMTPQVRNRPHRYSNSAADTLLPSASTHQTAGAIDQVNSFRRLPDIADTLDLELSKLDIQKAAAMGQDAAAAAALSVGRHSRSSHGYHASTQAQQRLMLAGTAAGIGAAAAAAGGTAGGLDW